MVFMAWEEVVGLSEIGVGSSRFFDIVRLSGFDFQYQETRKLNPNEIETTRQQPYG